MYELGKLFFDIAIFKKGPQDVPFSPWLLRLLVLVYALVNLLVLKMSNNLLDSLLQVGLEVILVLAFAWLMTTLSNRKERYPQTACALVGTDALISVFALPALATLVGKGNLFSFIMVVVLMLWHWLVTAHIIRHTLSQPLLSGLGIAFLYFVVSYHILAMFFPALATQ